MRREADVITLLNKTGTQSRLNAMGKIGRLYGQVMLLPYADLMEKSRAGHGLPGPPAWNGPLPLSFSYFCQVCVDYTRVSLHLLFLSIAVEIFLRESGPQSRTTLCSHSLT